MLVRVGVGCRRKAGQSVSLYSSKVDARALLAPSFNWIINMADSIPGHGAIQSIDFCCWNLLSCFGSF